MKVDHINYKIMQNFNKPIASVLAPTKVIPLA